MPAVAQEEKVAASESFSAILPAPLGQSARRVAPWAEWPIAARLRVLRGFRHLLASNAGALADAIPAALPRTRADSLVAEVLPLLAAIKFLEAEAKAILAPRRLGRRGLPFWLSGLDATVERVPLGSVLILAPFNYPLLLPGVQAVQALVAGNSVVWKPGRGGRPVADFFARLLTQAGLPQDMLRVTADTTAAAELELALKPAKVLFTGSAATGRAILRAAAETLTPVTAELSGCDAVLVLPTADPKVVADAILFGLRLNGSQTCMAPRRLILVDTPAGTPNALDRSGTRPLHPTHRALLDLLQQALPTLPATNTQPPAALLQAATNVGATVDGTPGRPYLVLNASPDMAIAQSDIFYPVLSVLRAASPEEALKIHAASPLSLTAAIFGNEPTTTWLASRLQTGTVLINDLIVPTADPRIPFGGRGESGFGTTRGREGLLELTAARTITRRRNKNYRHFQPTTQAHEALFTGLIELTHAGTWSQRYAGLRKLIAAARTL